MKLVFRGADVVHKMALLARRLPGVVDAALYQLAVEMRGDFEKTTASWDTPVSFTVQKDKRGYRVFTKSQIYKFVDLGTRAHVIKAKRGKVLAFPGGYAAKTRPGVIGSGPGGGSGTTQFAQEVHHPGTKARRFTKILYAKYQKQTGPRVQRAIRYGVEAIGI